MVLRKAELSVSLSAMIGLKRPFHLEMSLCKARISISIQHQTTHPISTSSPLAVGKDQSQHGTDCAVPRVLSRDFLVAAWLQTTRAAQRLDQGTRIAAANPTKPNVHVAV